MTAILAIYFFIGLWFCVVVTAALARQCHRERRRPQSEELVAALACVPLWSYFVAHMIVTSLASQGSGE